MATRSDKLRVRVGKNYNAHFNCDHGQRNAELYRRPMTPLVRLNPRFDSVALIEPGYDLIHSFNSIPVFTRTPFIVTFESYCPRLPEDRPLPWLEQYLTRILLSSRCLRIVAMSQYAVRQFNKQHAGKQCAARLLDKVEVIHPGLHPRRHEPKEKIGNALKLLFVGKDYFRKGGPAVVRAHRILRQRGVPVETTIVSALRWSPSDYIGPPDPVGTEKALEELAVPELKLFKGLPNASVRELMGNSDFLVFPTFHETYGYVSLEALAAATPVITTATAAQSEIVEDGRSGFLLPFDNDSTVGRWSWIYRKNVPGYNENYWSEVDRLAGVLADRLSEFWELRGDYHKLSAGALTRMLSHFHSERVRDRLEQLYEGARR
jgi:glycosyltransferase involved in cell wall biosynthesis